MIGLLRGCPWEYKGFRVVDAFGYFLSITTLYNVLDSQILVKIRAAADSAISVVIGSFLHTLG